MLNLNPGAETAPNRRGSCKAGVGLDGEAARCCRLLEVAVAAAYAVPLCELRAPTRRSPTVAFARQSAMYLAHVVLDLSFTVVAGLFERDRTTAAHACRLVEERRDDPAVDSVLSALESVFDSRSRGLRAEDLLAKNLAAGREVRP
jgi:hypothetical protein